MELGWSGLRMVTFDLKLNGKKEKGKDLAIRFDK